jgi:hypothetical protein
LGNLGVDGRIILKWVLTEKDMKLWAGFMGMLRVLTSGWLLRRY